MIALGHERLFSEVSATPVLQLITNKSSKKADLANTKSALT
jgi:hypothetical protein